MFGKKKKKTKKTKEENMSDANYLNEEANDELQPAPPIEPKDEELLNEDAPEAGEPENDELAREDKENEVVPPPAENKPPKPAPKEDKPAWYGREV